MPALPPAEFKARTFTAAGSSAISYVLPHL
jgi:hypothetical protein